MKKFSAIDVFIILAFLFIVTFVCSKVTKQDTHVNPIQKIQFTVLVTYVDNDIKDVVSVGDKVQITPKEKIYATVVGIVENDYMADSFNPALKRFVTSSIKGKSDLLLTLVCDATVSDREIQVGDEFFARVGEQCYIIGKGYGMYGFIVTVEDFEEEVEK